MAPEGHLALPLIAILRGIEPTRIAQAGRILLDAGIQTIEVPLNSPDPFASIANLSAKLGHACLCGAGTVLDPTSVRHTFEAGGRLIVAPNTDPCTIAAAIELKMVVIPGFATPTEAFDALRAGAKMLKLFPASVWGQNYLRALRTVLPNEAQVYAVGGVTADDVPHWVRAGASGFGFGSELFRPSYSDKEFATRARDLVKAVRSAIAVQ